VLKVDGVRAAYGPVEALRGVDLEVKAGELVCLLGANGAGKSSTLRAISGLVRPTAGRILFEDRAITGAEPAAVLAAGIAHCPEGRRVFPALSVRDNVMVGLHLRGRARVLAILLGRRAVRDEETRLAAEAEAVMALVGLEHRRDEVAGALPYGEQRLVELAVALAARPRLLLLDEPGAGMTGGEKERLIERIRGLRDGGMTVLLVEHDMRLVMSLCDRVTVLDFGRVIADGAPDEVQHNPAVVAAYLGEEERRSSELVGA